ncbi:MAG: hypothetical protein FWD68_21415 [Alphaproteobacteria bacterium]|nr:hypothetical protein [Alphaproteobacteria bacterium]
METRYIEALGLISMLEALMKAHVVRIRDLEALNVSQKEVMKAQAGVIRSQGDQIARFKKLPARPRL